MIVLSGIRHRILHIPKLVLPGGHISVIGPNGSGKTTLLEICAGITLPFRGTVEIGGNPPRAQSVGWVCEFPDRHLLFERVSDEIASPLKFNYTTCREINERVKWIAGQVGIGHLLDSTVRSLSGGEKALVGLATAMVADPEVLIIDEIDTHLDRRTADNIQEVLERSNIPVILQSTQNMASATSACSTIYLEEGRIRHIGTPEEVFHMLRESCFYPQMWRVQG